MADRFHAYYGELAMISRRQFDAVVTPLKSELDCASLCGTVSNLDYEPLHNRQCRATVNNLMKKLEDVS